MADSSNVTSTEPRRINEYWSSVTLDKDSQSKLQSADESFAFEIAIDDQNTRVTAVFHTSYCLSLKNSGPVTSSTSPVVIASVPVPVQRECKTRNGDVYQNRKNVGTVTVHCISDGTFWIHIYIGKQYITISASDPKVKGGTEYILHSRIVEPLPCGYGETYTASQTAALASKASSVNGYESA